MAKAEPKDLPADQRHQTNFGRPSPGFLRRRFAPAHPDPDHQILPVNGTREALFAVAQALSRPLSKAADLAAQPLLSNL